MTSVLCPLGFWVSSPAWQAGHTFPYVSYQERSFHLPSCQSSRVQICWVRSVHLCYTTAVMENHSQPISFLKSSSPGSIKICCCLPHNTTQAENNPDKMTEMWSCGSGLHWQDLSFPEGSYFSPAGTVQGSWKLVFASLPSQLKEILYFFCVCVFVLYVPAVVLPLP